MTQEEMTWHFLRPNKTILLSRWITKIAPKIIMRAKFFIINFRFLNFALQARQLIEHKPDWSFVKQVPLLSSTLVNFMECNFVMWVKWSFPPHESQSLASQFSMRMITSGETLVKVEAQFGPGKAFPHIMLCRADVLSHKSPWQYELCRYLSSIQKTWKLGLRQ